MAYSNSIVALPPAPGPAVGVALHLGLLAGLSATIGLGAAGWAVGTGSAVGLAMLLGAALRAAGRRSLGPADRFTFARGLLACAVAGPAVDALGGRPVPTSAVVALTVPALLLDAVDGQVARRTGTVTPLGARFDMEVDAFLMLVLCVLLVGPVGPWVLAIGGMRYAFLAAGRTLPWLTAPMPPRFGRKVVAALQGVVLVVAVAGVLPGPVMTATLAAALAALCWSFGRDVIWLDAARRGLVAAPARPGARPAPATEPV